VTFEEIVEEVLKLPVEQKKQLIMIIVDSIIEDANRTDSILDYRGIGAHLRDDAVDSQDQVNQMREEWDET